MQVFEIIKKRAFPIIAIAVFLFGVSLFLAQIFNIEMGGGLENGTTDKEAGAEVKTARELGAMPLKEQTEYWKGRIGLLGGEEAYEEFHRIYEGVNSNEQHAAAHIFGGELYAVEGVDGFSVCDLQYSYGCYHEFLGQAIFHEGMQVVDTLNEGCHRDLASVGQELSCQHGIGHGVLAAVGYETETLTDALTICKDLPYSDPIGGCYGGVFMEYNVRTMLMLDGVPPRPRESENPLEPCASMPEYSKVACYYWQPQWWSTVLRGEGEHNAVAIHEKMGAWCRLIDDPELRDTCVEGIGNNLIADGDTPEKATRLCQAATTDLRSEVLCRSDAANTFFTVPELKDSAHELCEGLEGEYYDYCYAHSINHMNLANPGNI